MKEGSGDESLGNDLNEPLFWFSEHWMQKIYLEGKDITLRQHERNPPRRYESASGITKEEGNCERFYWTPIAEGGNTGFRLFAKRREDNEEYSPVVEIRNGADHDEYRLFASRDFDFGDAIVFMPTFEQRCGMFVLGGMYARTEYGKEGSNAYLTSNSVLRCLTGIKEGEEIVRWIQEDEYTGYLESVDQVVVSPDKMLLGKIGSEVFGRGPGRFIHFCDGSIDIAKRRHLFVYRNLCVLPM